MNRGKYIVIEGLANYRHDILQRLARQLAAAQLPVKIFREPESQNDLTARSINRLTHDPRYPMSSRTEVLLYNAARVQSLEAIRQAVDNGVICLVDRSYLTTLAVQYYGYGDIDDYQRINEIIEFALDGRQPDLSVVLDTPVAELDHTVSHKFLVGRPDVDTDAFLERVRAGYLWEAKQRNLPVVYTTPDIEAVFKDVWKYVAEALAVRERGKTTTPESVGEVLASRQSRNLAVEPPIIVAQTDSPANDTATADYIVPKRLDKKLAADYRRTLDELLRRRAELLAKLPDDEPATGHIGRLLLPVAVYGADDMTIARELAIDPNDTFARLASDQQHNGHTRADEPDQLIHYWPRNEFDLLPDMLYRYGELSYRDLRNQAGQWSYQQKTGAFKKYLRGKQSDALEQASYTLELLVDYDSLLKLRSHGVVDQHQPLTPRYGYAVPERLEAAGLTEAFEACFDTSLSLHSRLQAAGLATEAQFATLLGHKLRAVLTLTAKQLLELCAPDAAEPSLQPILADLCGLVAEVHPLLGARLQPRG